jgi:hypothetical protein
MLEEKFRVLTKRFEEFTAKFDENQPLTFNKKNKGKGKGKSSKKSVSLSDQINIEAQKRLTEFLREERIPQNEIPSTSYSRQMRSDELAHGDSRSEYSNFTEDLSVAGTTKRTIFIRRVDCLLNSVPIDQIEDKQTGINNIALRLKV